MKQQLAAGLCKGQVTEFIQNQQVDAAECVGGPALPAQLDLRFQLVDEVDGIEEACLPAGADAMASDTDGDVGLPGSSAANKDNIALLSRKAPVASNSISPRFIGVSSSDSSASSLASGSLAIPIW
jgi:hypothetical protein